MNLRRSLFFCKPSHYTPNYFGIDAAGLATWLALPPAVNNYANRHKYNPCFHLLSNYAWGGGGVEKNYTDCEGQKKIFRPMVFPRDRVTSAKWQN